MRPLLLWIMICSCTLLQGQGQAFSFSDSAILHRLKQDIFLLASDSFQGRDAGTRGDSLSADYIISQFQEVGLKPRGDDSGSFLQPVPHKYNYHSWSNNYLYTDYDRYRYRKDFGMTSLSSNGKADGRILVVGHGIVDSALLLNDYSGKADPAGRILMMEFPLPDDLQGDSLYQQKLSIRQRLSEAFRRDAAAVMLWNSNSPNYPDLFNLNQADTLPGPVIFLAETVARQLKRLEGQPVHLKTELVRINAVYNNLVGFLDNNASQTVIIGAHYDHVGINSKGAVKCGADDNASGVALMIELARFLRQQENQQQNYMFIAFGAEEMGMIGSDYFCDHPVIPIEEVRFMCNFDMVGRLGAEGNRLTALGTATSPQWKGIYKEMPKYSFRIKKYKGASNFSDQECFYKERVPVFYLTTGLHPDYHTHRDRPERINFTGMVPITRFAEEFIKRTEEFETIEFKEVSGWATFFADVNYYLKQIGHMFDIPIQDF